VAGGRTARRCALRPEYGASPEETGTIWVVQAHGSSTPARAAPSAPAGSAYGLALTALTAAVGWALLAWPGTHPRPESVRAARAASTLTSARSVSSNWSGYAVTSPGVTYTSVTATWKQPAASCGQVDAGAQSAFWVGLGGYSSTSQALEQIGSDSDCSAGGQPDYYAWYELVPAAAVQLGIKIEAGNTVTVSVNAIDGGTTIELQIINRSRGVRVTKLLPFASPDLSSAEWIAEAPSECSRDSCQTEPLADFGSVSFTRIAALGNGVGGTVSNPAWSADQIELRPGDSSRGYFPGPDRFSGSPDSGAGARSGPLAAGGNAFSVAWVADAASA
jgi:hypothetical protein